MTELSPPPRFAEPEPRELAVIAAFLRRHLRLSTAIIAGCLMLAAMLSLVLPKFYYAEAAMSYDPQASPIRGGGGLAMTDAQRDAEIDAQLAEVMSLPVALDVAHTTDLSASARLQQQADAVAASSERRISRAEALGTALLAHVKARRVGQTPMFAIGYSADGAEVAARIANAFASSYLKLGVRQKLALADAAAQPLSGRIADLHRQVADAETQASAFRLDNDLLANPDSLAPEQDVSTIRSQLAEASGHTAQAGARAAAAGGAVVGGGGGGSVDTSAVSGLIQQRAANAAELAGLLGRYGEKYPDVIAARQKLAATDALLAASMHDNRDSAEAEASAAAARSAALTTSLAEARTRLAASLRSSAELTDLQNRAQALRQAYQDLLKIRADGEAERALIQPDAQQIAVAEPPLRPSFPRLGIMVLGGLGLGLAISAICAFIRDSRRYPGDRGKPEDERAEERQSSGRSEERLFNFD